MVLAGLDRRGSPASPAVDGPDTRVVEGGVVLGPDGLTDPGEDVLVRIGAKLAVGGRVEGPLVGDDVGRRAAVVAVDVDVGRPLVHDLGDQGVDLLGLELHVVPVHVVAGFVGAPTNLSPVRIDEGHDDHDDVIEDRAELSGHELLGDELDRLLRRHLAAVDRGRQQHDGLARADRVLGVRDGRIGDGHRIHLPVQERVGEGPHAHDLAHGVELVPELHEGLEGRRPRAEVLLLLPRERELLRLGTRGRNQGEGERGEDRPGSERVGAHEASIVGGSRVRERTR